LTGDNNIFLDIAMGVGYYLIFFRFLL
jgi:hypothetical protein